MLAKACVFVAQHRMSHAVRADVPRAPLGYPPPEDLNSELCEAFCVFCALCWMACPKTLMKRTP